MFSNMLTKKRSVVLSTIASSCLIAILFVACNNGGSEKEPECVPAVDNSGKQIKKKVTEFGLRIGERTQDSSKDWCRACVMSKMGFASCQKVYAANEGQDRKIIRANAREKACLDAQFPQDACPEQAVISITCKDEAAPSGTKSSGQALQDLFLMGKKPSAKATAKETLKKDPVKETLKKDMPVIE